jgi:hypothetical protein
VCREPGRPRLNHPLRARAWAFPITALSTVIGCQFQNFFGVLIAGKLSSHRCKSSARMIVLLPRFRAIKNPCLIAW